MPGVYGWDIGGCKAVAAKVEDGGVAVVPNKLTGDRFTPVVVPETPSGGVRQIGVHSAHSQGDLRDVNDVSKMASFMTHLKDNTTSGQGANCYVLTVPHYFYDAEVSAVLDAFHVSGASDDGVVVDVMPDLTAAALAHGYYRAAASEKKRVVLVDFGHSAVQAALVEFTPEGLKVLAYDYDRLTGGKIMTQNITNKLMKDFIEEDNTISVSKRAARKLSRAAEQAKKTMSANKDNIPVSVECFHDDRDLTGAICRSEFEAMCQDSFDRVRQCLLRLKAQAAAVGEVQSVEVIGGSSRIPMFKEVVAEVFEGLPVRTSLNGDEAVAKGAALHCAAVTNLYRVRPYRVTDVLQAAHPVRIKYSGDKVQSVSPGHTTVLDGRPEGDTVVLEYENSPAAEGQKSLIAVYQLDLPADVEESVNMEFTLKRRRWELHRCTLEGQELKFTESRVGGLTHQQLSQSRREERRLMEQDRAEIQRQDVKNQLEEAVNAFRSVLSESEAQHQKVVEEASAFVQDSQDKIDNDDGYPDWSVEQYQSLLRQVEERSEVYQHDLIALSEQMKAEGRRLEAKKQFETGFDGFKSALSGDACDEETRFFKAASRFVESVQDAIDNDESYPTWPAEEYLSLLGKVRQLAAELQANNKYYFGSKGNQRDKRSPPKHHFGNHYTRQHPLFGMFDDECFDRRFSAQNHRPRSYQHQQPSFFDMFW